MGWTKRNFVEGAFEELGLASYTFDLQPDLLRTGLRKLDAMMGEWNARGIKLGYSLPITADGSDLDDVTEVPDRANEAVLTNLAVRLGPGVGKSALMETKATAKRAYNQLLTVAALPTEKRLQGMVAGAGNRPWIYGQPFIPETPAPLTTGPDGDLEFL